MIKSYVGDFGSGKTANMVWDLMLAMVKGRHVITNTPIEFDWDYPILNKNKHYKAEFIPNGKDFQKAISYRENCIMAIDEAAVYLPNIYWNKLPPELIVKFAQNRKYRTDFWYTTQLLSQSVKRLRELTHLTISCRRRVLIPSFKIGKKRFMGVQFLLSKRFNPAYFRGEQTEKKYKRYFWGARTLYPSQLKRIFKAYNTRYVVDFSAMMEVKGFMQPTSNKQSKELNEASNLEKTAEIAKVDIDELDA